MNKFFLIGMAALLSVSLFMTGCPTGDDDGGGTGFSSKTNKGTANAAEVLGLVGNRVASSNTAVATAALGAGDDAGKVVITSVGAGRATITVYETDDTEKYFAAQIPVTVAADGTITVNTAQIVQGEASTAKTYTLKKSAATGAPDDTGAGASGLSIAYARKGSTSKKVYIKVSGTVAGSYTYKANALTPDVQGADWDARDSWNNGSTGTPADGVYAGVYINGLIAAGNNIAIKQENHALRYYTAWTDANLIAETAPDAPAASNTDSVYVPPTNDTTTWPVKWRLYTIDANDTFSILLWNNAHEKKVTLDVDQYGADISEGKTGDIATIVLDYSAVTFN
jgi:hypothetical protein